MDNLNIDEIAYLIDFIQATLNENIEDDPFPLEEAEMLLNIKRKLRELYGKDL